MTANPTPPLLPDYVVLHDAVGGYAKGDTIPHGTYSEEQLARLVGLGAIAPADPPGLPIADPVAPPVQPPGEPIGGMPSPASAAPSSAEEFKAREDARAGSAVVTTMTGGGAELDAVDLTEAQRQALAEAGIRTAADVRAASDERLLEVPGIGPTTLQKLRDATRNEA
jgi:hypothetical protein